MRRETVREHVLAFFEPRRFERLTVLDRVTFEVAEGETLGIMGRNGSGKSTLLKILAGIYRADAGSVRVRGPLTSILELGVGWNPELNAVDNVLLIGSVMGLTLREAHRDLGEILAFAELERFANLELRHYSSGMSARLAYSVAFKAVRKILVLDEVFAVGDAAFRAKCEVRYRELEAAGTTILLVSHDPRLISTFCRRAILIDRGRILREGDSKVVAEDYVKLMAQPSTQ